MTTNNPVERLEAWCNGIESLPEKYRDGIENLLIVAYRDIVGRYRFYSARAKDSRSSDVRMTCAQNALGLYWAIEILAETHNPKETA